MVRYLLPFLNVTSKLAGHEWYFPGGRCRWIGWDSREQTVPVTGEVRQGESGEWDHFEYVAGRLVIELDAQAAKDDAQRAADALSGLIDLYGGPFGFQLTLMELPDGLSSAEALMEEDLADELRQHSFEQPLHMIGMGTGVHIGEEPVEWALEHVDTVVRDVDAGGGLLAALVLLFVSQLEFAFFGGDVRRVLALDEDEDAPQSAVDRVRIEESFHNCFKALESLVGGLPPRDERRLRARLLAARIDPDERDGFPSRDKETMLERVMRMRETRDKRAAHGGRTGVDSRKITFFELMDAQRATGLAIYRSVTAKRADS
jgi:hypothetical protein